MVARGENSLWLVIGVLEKDSVVVTCLSNVVYFLGMLSVSG